MESWRVKNIAKAITWLVATGHMDYMSFKEIFAESVMLIFNALMHGVRKDKNHKLVLIWF